MWGRAKPKNSEIGGDSVKELFHFVDQYHKLPEEPLRKCTESNSFRKVSLVLNAAEQKGMFGLMQVSLLTMEQSQKALCTMEVIPKQTASLVDWIKATVRSVNPKKEDCPTPPYKYFLL